MAQFGEVENHLSHVNKSQLVLGTCRDLPFPFPDPRNLHRFLLGLKLIGRLVLLMNLKIDPGASITLNFKVKMHAIACGISARPYAR